MNDRHGENDRNLEDVPGAKDVRDNQVQQNTSEGGGDATPVANAASVAANSAKDAVTEDGANTAPT